MTTKDFMLLMCAFIAAAVCSCSSYEDPEEMLKGKIDESVLLEMEKGEVALDVYSHESNLYVRDYSWEDGQGIGKWKVSEYIGFTNEGCDPSNFVIYNGSGWQYLDYWEDFTPVPTELAMLWDSYRYYTDCKTSFYNYLIRYPIEYDTQNKILKFGKNELNVIKADKNYMTCTQLSLGYGGEEFKPEVEFKAITTYKIRSIDPAYFENRYFFDTEREAKLDIVRKLREYFGDTVDTRDYENLSKINTVPRIYDLAKLEALLIEGKSDDIMGWLTFPEMNEEAGDQ